jgi:hypothetical protein
MGVDRAGVRRAMVSSTKMSFDVLPTIRKDPRLDGRMAPDTARRAALVASRP